MYHRDPLDGNLYAFDPPEEDGPVYLDEEAEPTLEQLIEPEEVRGEMTGLATENRSAHEADRSALGKGGWLAGCVSPCPAHITTRRR